MHELCVAPLENEGAETRGHVIKTFSPEGFFDKGQEKQRHRDIGTKNNVTGSLNLLITK